MSTKTSASPASKSIFRKQLSRNAETTMRIGAALAASLSPGDVVALSGELGTGKTVLIKGICRALDVRQPVTSPTFTLIHEYKGRMPIYHFDLYRINTPDEFLELGADDYLYGEGICLIEWAEKVRDYLPKRRIEIHLAYRFDQGINDDREIRIERL